ncbi:MAG: carboxypeptidase regulatory-like domain-containing protein [Bryobacterales bacterium]|nr:carboxypeptidase regulatory-like domain-containing protein [Bryobacterales bacterium]
MVTDPTGGAVPGAVIRLDSQSRNLRVRETVTASDGRYTFPQILPDRYRVTASAHGFGNVTAAGVEVVNTPARLDLRFEKVGDVASSVTVAAEAGQVNTVDASLVEEFRTDNHQRQCRPVTQVPRIPLGKHVRQSEDRIANPRKWSTAWRGSIRTTSFPRSGIWMNIAIRIAARSARI